MSDPADLPDWDSLSSLVDNRDLQLQDTLFSQACPGLFRTDWIMYRYALLYCLHALYNGAIDAAAIWAERSKHNFSAGLAAMPAAPYPWNCFPSISQSRSSRFSGYHGVAPALLGLLSVVASLPEYTAIKSKDVAASAALVLVERLTATISHLSKDAAAVMQSTFVDGGALENVNNMVETLVLVTIAVGGLNTVAVAMNKVTRVPLTAALRPCIDLLTELLKTVNETLSLALSGPAKAGIPAHIHRDRLQSLTNFRALLVGASVYTPLPKPQ